MPARYNRRRITFVCILTGPRSVDCQSKYSVVDHRSYDCEVIDHTPFEGIDPDAFVIAMYA